MVQISGSSERHIVDLKQGDYEELDQLTAAEPFAKAAYRVNRVEDIGRGVARAIRTAVVRAPRRRLPRHPGRSPRRKSSTPRPARASLRPRQSTRHRASCPRPRRWTARSTLLARRRSGRWWCWARAPHTRRRTSEIRAFIEATGLPLPADVDGQGPAARRPPAVGGRRAVRSRCTRPTS